jgi:acyl-CoA synthetase (AMP-forming)/AMP-acid ligase II
VVEAAERWAVTEMTASPPVVMAMAKEPRVLEALERVVCGGAPLPTTAAERFQRRFANVDLCMVSFCHVSFLIAFSFSFKSYQKENVKPTPGAPLKRWTCRFLE